MYHRIVFLAFLLLSLNVAIGQTIINHYAAVTDGHLISCSNTITVDDAAGFDIGDTILMIQMKGAIIDTSNTDDFGTIIDYRGAGNHEYNVIQDKNGNNITLKYLMAREYNIPDGKVQMVSVPNYQDYTVSQLHTCLPWDGNKGGVFAMIVAGTLTMDSDIDVSGKGFRGGKISNNPDGACGSGSSGYYYPLVQSSTTIWNEGGAEKGEGIATISESKMAGRGPLANGGGGGNKHNTGGGGGANVLVGPGIYGGGKGGNALGGCINTPTGGLGGVGLEYFFSPNKIYFGGGGGCGDDNNGVGTQGQNGGGIAIIQAGTWIGNGFTVRANGADQILQGTGIADGAGGGGAGGTVVLKANTYSTQLFADAKGGKGGDQVPTWGCVGPGGGGGGGIIFHCEPNAFPTLVNGTLTGGAAGMFLTPGLSCSNTSYGAEPGFPGATYHGLELNFPTDIFDGLIVDFSDSLMDCYTIAFKDLSTAADGVVSWQWSFPGGSAAIQDPSYTFPGPGTYLVTLTVTDANGCTASKTREIIIPPTDFLNVTSDGNGVSCSQKNVQLFATGAASYRWSPGIYCNDSTSASPMVSPPGTTLFTVTGIDENGCTEIDTITVYAVPEEPVVFVPNAFSPNGDGHNDEIRALIVCGFELQQFAIYNRWGERVFLTGNPNEGWHGMYKNKPAGLGTYFYIIKGLKNDKTTSILKGDFVLLR